MSDIFVCDFDAQFYFYSGARDSAGVVTWSKVFRGDRGGRTGSGVFFTFNTENEYN